MKLYIIPGSLAAQFTLLTSILYCVYKKNVVIGNVVTGKQSYTTFKQRDWDSSLKLFFKKPQKICIDFAVFHF